VSINGLLNTGRSAIQVNQAALQVTSHNIANVNTPGFTRQRLSIETTTPFMTGAGPIGTGVRAQEIKRVYDRFLSFQVKGERERFGMLSAEKDAISRIEGVFNEVGGSGISERLADFFNSLNDLSGNAAGYAERRQALAKADMLGYAIRSKASALSDLRNSIDADIRSRIGEVNTIAAEIAGLNEKIAEQEMGGDAANDLRDRRDMLMGDLSGLIDYDSMEDASGRVSIFVGKGSVLVDGKRYNTLSGVANAANDNLTDIYISSGSGTTNITSDVNGGILKGLLEVRDAVVPDFQDRLNSFASTLANEFNAQHAAGFGLDGSTGLSFFSFTAGNEAATISVGITDAGKVAAAASDPLTASGPADNGNALLLAGIRDRAMGSLGNATLDSYFNAMVSDAGTRSQLASKGYEYQKFAKEQIENRMEAVSGVSLDEEAANLIKFQRAFEAAAKMITTADEMMRTILELKR
jgi:flagellar hook-associated protein 1 FlgK